MESLHDFFDLLIHSDKLIQFGGLTLLLLIVFLETGVFFGFIFAGDALLFSAGVLCGTSILDVNLFILLLSLTAAAFAGNLTGYYTGRFLGRRLLRKEDTWYFKQKHLRRTRIFYKKYGGISLIAGRFVWVVRTFVPILAGATGMKFRPFNLYNITGAVIWVWTIVPLGYLAGHMIPSAEEHLEYFILGITIIATVILLMGIIKASRDKGT